MRHSRLWLLALLLLFSFSHAEARLEVCNQTDLVLMVVVGYHTTDQRIATEGWWRIYPGMCEIPIDVTLLKGSYFVHAESNPRSTMPDDAFAWGDQKPLCVKLSDFRMPNGNQCGDSDVAISFNQIDKNWRNSNKVNIYSPKRTYENQFRTQVAGVQRMLSIIGYEMGEIDGVIGEATATALNEVSRQSNIFGFDFAVIFPALEKIIAEQQKLDN
ncbi:MAG: putative membrane protein [Arenicella sp.]|jgi:uncharacterized membrane protein